MQTKELFQATKQECHSRVDKAYEDWSHVLKQTVKTAVCHEDMEGTIRSFVYVDTLSKNTKASLERANKALDLLLETKSDLSTHFKMLDEIQQMLDTEHIMKETMSFNN
ncbi:hypothetical protein G6F43_000911 [Rhizopus delemar]|nr:hypothetical protein G6F43_000911 [Rhizopus delemar]